MSGTNPHQRVRTRWQPIAATATGSVHQRDGEPAQDSSATWAEDGCAVVAVADGHGHPAHYRSGTGSRFAAEIACDLLATAVRDFGDAEQTAQLLADRIGPALIEGWTAACLSDARRHPGPGAARPPELLAYGTTVIAMAASPQVVAVLQLGDGDAVIAAGDGEVWRPLPEDPDLHGVVTTSLCQPDPLRSLRSTAMPVHRDDLVLGFVSTDGFGVPREDPERWWVQVGQQLVGHLQRHGTDWIASRLPGWLVEPAEYGGDDTTVGVLMRTD